MRGLIVAALMAAALPSVSAHAQAVASTATADPEWIAASILEPLKRSDVDGALKAVQNRSPSTSTNLPGRIAGVRAQMVPMIASNGPVVGWERIKSEPLGTLMRRDTYLVQYKGSVLRWRFTYMRVEAGWMIAGFDFDDSADNWF